MELYFTQHMAERNLSITAAVRTLLPANVDSVALGQNGGEMKLNLAGIGSVPLSQVQIIGQ